MLDSVLRTVLCASCLSVTTTRHSLHTALHYHYSLAKLNSISRPKHSWNAEINLVKKTVTYFYIFNCYTGFTFYTSSHQEVCNEFLNCLRREHLIKVHYVSDTRCSFEWIVLKILLTLKKDNEFDFNRFQDNIRRFIMLML